MDHMAGTAQLASSIPSCGTEEKRVLHYIATKMLVKMESYGPCGLDGIEADQDSRCHILEQSR